MVDHFEREGICFSLFTTLGELGDFADLADVMIYRDGDYSEEVSSLLRQRARKLRWMQLLSAGSDKTAGHGVRGIGNWPGVSTVSSRFSRRAGSRNSRRTCR